MAATTYAAPEILAPFVPLTVGKPGAATSSIVQLTDGTWLTTEGNSTLRSRDGGATWGDRRVIVESVPTNGPRAHGIPGGQAMLLRTHDNVLVLVWRDERVDDWDQKTGELGPNARGDVWAARSPDEGVTWIDRQKLFAGVCGHPPINMLQLHDGTIVVPVQFYTSGPLRCVIRTYASRDDGRTWAGGNIIDLGGHGHHDGAFEPSLAELRDGRVWMLIRTNWDRFWEAFSSDGRNWRTIRPSTIGASSSPPYLLRLASGRLALFWNRLYPEGRTSYERRAAPYSDVAGSWHREELSMALSDDDGATWTRPQLIAREPGKWLAYTYAFEPVPGEVWLFTGQGKVAARVLESALPRTL